MSNNINELSEISRKHKRPNTPDIKNHKFARDGFSYRTAYFQDFDGVYYKIVISVGHTGDVATVCNVGKLKRDTLPAGKIVSSIRGSKANSASLNKMILQKYSSVNTEFMQDSQNYSEIKKSLKAEDDAPTAIDRYYAEAIRENRAFSQIFALMGDMYSTKMGEVYLDKERAP